MLTQWEVIDNPWNRPQIEVLIGGVCYRGEVRARRRNDDHWEAWFTYSIGVARTCSGVFVQDVIRPDETLDERQG